MGQTTTLNKQLGASALAKKRGRVFLATVLAVVFLFAIDYALGNTLFMNKTQTRL